MAIKDSSLKLAIKNIASFGDTDVFPMPIEKHWFVEDAETVFNLLVKLRSDLDAAFRWLPITSSTELVNVGHFGFRSATQIEPLWNVFFLAAAIELAEVFESKRQPSDRVFSYRFAPDEESGGLFSNCGWRDFHKQGIKIARSEQFVAVVDISDFYPRIYHHRLENALTTDCGCDGSIVKIIGKLLRRFNSGNSYGLPVGGAASRILAEALLVRSDRLLEIRKVNFLRFVDDYIIFGKTEDQVRSAILELSRILLDNEGLSLNRNKIRIYPSDWYIQQSVFADATPNQPDEIKQKKEYFSAFVRFDPYSETAEEDYETLRESVKKHDVLGWLFTEVERVPLDIYMVRQLIKSLKLMDKQQKSEGVKKLASCLKQLSPVFTTIARTFCGIRNDIDNEVASLFFKEVRNLVDARQPLIGASGTLAFAIQILSIDPNDAAELSLQSIFDRPDRTPIIEREVVMAMGRRASNSWVSDMKNRFGGLSSPWSKRALLVASFCLGDGGREWRKRIKKDLPEHDKLLLEWISHKNSGELWDIPL